MKVFVGRVSQREKNDYSLGKIRITFQILDNLNFWKHTPVKVSVSAF